MTILNTEYKHIQLNENNIPVIADTTMKVVELITSVKAYQWTPEQLHENYPHISMSKIYAALSYYWDHQAEIEADRERRYQLVEKLRRENVKSPISKKLKDQGLIE
jgi:uncharacterized protein (DUF433 family)